MDFNINTPIENPKLSNILLHLRETDKNNSDLINEYINEIAKEFALNAKCLSIIEIDEDSLEENSENQVIAKEDSKISFIHYETDDNRIFFPIFTGWSELRKGEEFKNKFVNTAVLTFDDYYSLVKNYNAGVVINPFSDNLIFSYEDICYMKQKKRWRNNRISRASDRRRYRSFTWRTKALSTGDGKCNMSLCKKC